jgi:hypothetical protein
MYVHKSEFEKLLKDYFYVHVKVWSSSSSICGIFYFKIIGIDAINKITKARIT